MAYESTIEALDKVLQLCWGDILDDQSLSTSQNERIQKASDLIQEVKKELEAELKEEENWMPTVPTRCCKYCGNREPQEGAELYYCPVKDKRVSDAEVCDDYKSFLH